ncbi:RNA polymerase II-associated factor 1 homolog [Falco rusticolus]|uniref:RNA polymerase II-associated factor 1 homolog n=1 Tax=Falco rusticolus TaxID=120794 RepID=UPI0018869D61|nr:RNA polymerase II-associated factor 1 homolog [Falco rusticolus]
MAPTIQTQAQREEPGHRPSSHRTLPERSGVVCRVKYCNSLPDIPFDPKFITYPFDQNRFVQYKATSLEKQHKHDLLTEPDLGVTIDLINPDTYRIDPSVLLDPADEKLLEEEIQAPTSSKRSQQHAKVVPWMRKTEYISTEFNRYGVSNEKPEVKIGVSVKQQFTEEEIYKDRDSQIAAIEKTFEDAQKAITQHYSKPRVTPIEVMPVFPDFKMWINPCAQVIFDSDPAPKDTSGPAALEMMSQAMIRGMMDEEGNQFVAYFLPVEETLRKRKRDQEEEMDYAPEDVYDYKIAREYNWNVKNKASKGYEENYFFIFREGDGVYYNELETRVRLSKRRARAGVQSGTNAVLVVKHRDMNEKELEAQVPLFGEGGAAAPRSPSSGVWELGRLPHPRRPHHNNVPSLPRRRRPPPSSPSRPRGRCPPRSAGPATAAATWRLTPPHRLRHAPIGPPLRHSRRDSQTIGLPRCSSADRTALRRHWARQPAGLVVIRPRFCPLTALTPSIGRQPHPAARPPSWLGRTAACLSDAPPFFMTQHSDTAFVYRLPGCSQKAFQHRLVRLLVKGNAN